MGIPEEIETTFSAQTVPPNTILYRFLHKEVGQQPFCQNGTAYFCPTGQSGAPPDVVPNRTESKRTFFYVTSDRNFRNRWLNVKHPLKQSKLTR